MILKGFVYYSIQPIRFEFLTKIGSMTHLVILHCCSSFWSQCSLPRFISCILSQVSFNINSEWALGITHKKYAKPNCWLISFLLLDSREAWTKRNDKPWIKYTVMVIFIYFFNRIQWSKLYRQSTQHTLEKWDLFCLPFVIDFNLQYIFCYLFFVNYLQLLLLSLGSL